MKFKISFAIAAIMLLSGSGAAQKADAPSLTDALSWMHSFAEAHAFQVVGDSSDDDRPCTLGAHDCQERRDSATFNSRGCSASVARTLTLDHKNIGVTTFRFSMKDLDPNGLEVVDDEPFQNAVSVNTTNSVRAISESILLPNGSTAVSKVNDRLFDIPFDTKDDANRFVAAFKQAIQLCGGKPSNY